MQNKPFTSSNVQIRDYRTLTGVISFNESNSLPTKIESPVSFEKKPIINITYEIPKGMLIEKLVSEVRKLKKRVEELEKGKSLVLTESLRKIWDNKKDDVWNNY